MIDLVKTKHNLININVDLNLGLDKSDVDYALICIKLQERNMKVYPSMIGLYNHRLSNTLRRVLHRFYDTYVIEGA